jgi:HNH endonuclease/Homing endonuclease associated repeat
MPRFEINFLDEYSDEALLNELRRVAALIPPGESLTGRAFKENFPKVSYSTIQRRFGGWKEALDKAGLGRLYDGPVVSQKMRSQARMSKAGLIAELRRVHALLGKEWLTSGEFNMHSITSEGAVRNHFGTFRKGLEAAGILQRPHKLRQFTDEQCFENIAAVWTHYGRRPAYREMFVAPSKIRPKTYVERWGTWRKALKAFVEWANAASGTEEVAEEPRQETGGDSVKVDRKPDRGEADCREIRPGLRFKVFTRDRFCCRSCGRSPATHLGIVLHADHIVAVANGGKTTLENLQTLCQNCNLGKGRGRVAPTSPTSQS